MDLTDLTSVVPNYDKNIVQYLFTDLSIALMFKVAVSRDLFGIFFSMSRTHLGP